MKNILLIITGSISCYKMVDFIRNMAKQEFKIKVIMSKSAQSFITKLLVEALSKNKVYDNVFDLDDNAGMDHILLSRWADLVLIAPATANIISKVAHGLADDFISTVILASNKPLFIAPSMNVEMWDNKLFQRNVKILKENDVTFVGPESGLLACGEVGQGRLADISEIEKIVKDHLRK